MSRGLFANQLLSLAHEIQNQKKANIVEYQAYCEEKQKTNVHAMTTSGFHIWFGIQ